MVVLSQWPLTFEDLNLHTWLVVCMSSKGLGLLGRNLGVSWNEVGHYSASSLNSLRKRSNINQEHIPELFAIGCLSITENCGLNCSTVGNCFVWVDRSIELFAIEEIRKHLLDLGDSG